MRTTDYNRMITHTHTHTHTEPTPQWYRNVYAPQWPRCSLPGCAAACFIETHADGRIFTHPFCHRRCALEFHRQNNEERSRQIATQ